MFWRQLDEQPKDATDIVGLCHGEPPQLLLVPMRINATPTGVVVAQRAGPQQEQVAFVPQKHLPPMLQGESGCSRHPDAATEFSIHVHKGVMQWVKDQQLAAIPAQGNA